MVATQTTITTAEADEMPRPPINRFVEHLPEVTYFKPAGVPLRALEEIQLTVDELEAIRLKDLEGLEQEEASARMGVARTTFRRILVGARAKIAEALVYGKAIRIGGGTFTPAVRHFKCGECGAEFTEPFGSGVRGRDLRCGQCGSQSVFRADARRMR